MSKYAVVIEKSSNGYGAYIADLPGCVAVGETTEEVEHLIREGVALHLEAMRNDGVRFRRLQPSYENSI